MKNSDFSLQLREEAANGLQNDAYIERMEHEKRMAEEQRYLKYFPSLKGRIFLLVLSTPELNSSDDSDHKKNDGEPKRLKLKHNWAKLSPEKRLGDAGFKVGKWSQSTFCPQPFPSNIPTILFYKGLMASLKTALEAVGDNRPTTAQKTTIKTASRKLLTATNQIMTVWQNKADDDLENAASIASDGGFDHEEFKYRGSRKQGLFKSVEPGVLIGKLSGSGSRQWQMTDDGGKTVIDLDPTSSGVKELRDLISDAKYGLRGRKILTKGRYGAWSDWMFEHAP